MSAEPRRSPRFGLSLVAAMLLVSAAVTGAAAQSPSPVVPPDASVEAPAASPDPGDGAIPAVPDPRVTDAKPAPWTRIEIAPDGRTLTVYFWNGAPGCYGMKDVQVTVVDGLTTVTVYAGLLPEAISRTCIDIAQLYKTVVVLDAPILGGGGA